ncbi:hypothetical protein C2I18_25095 [Paenibacillus sp. PK3_47]|uniref:hypothetical protein n=1 Tax=Paenibacillus sp. PK3_47 TaxID=2072642 RepID=UPI00201DB69D|nr:hypothetical protein [Paenibacillus sp. PK3_47]UQZ36521.1 hypothetical protein C2I18_25095 [Paenibacillus sp. PK3_47]
MRKILIIICTLFLLLLTFGFIRVNTHKSLLNREMNNYLVTKGYAEEQYEVKVSYHIDNVLLGYNPYIIKVTYSDDPGSFHFFEYNSKKKELTQTGIAPNNNFKKYNHVD